MSCVRCLQTTTASDQDGNDQGWFLCEFQPSTLWSSTNLSFVIDNLRYALDTCLFGFANSSDFVSSPCATDSSCGPLRTSLESDNLTQSSSEFGYCTADNSAFLGASNGRCTNCLRDTDNQVYFANCKYSKHKY